jgi:hypothetical protein
VIKGYWEHELIGVALSLLPAPALAVLYLVLDKGPWVSPNISLVMPDKEIEYGIGLGDLAIPHKPTYTLQMHAF